MSAIMTIGHGPGRARVVWVLIDGLGDVACAELGGSTPLEAALTPTMDAIAAAGLNGLVDPVDVGCACGSDTAHMALFGYDPRKLYPGRGSFESIGAGIDMQPGDIAFKSNFATMDLESGMVLRRRADREFEREGPELCRYLDGLAIPGFSDVSVRFQYATEHRCGVRLRLEAPRQGITKLSSAITGTDPLVDNRALVTCEPTEKGNRAADFTAAVVQALHHEVAKRLSSHPINQERLAQGKPPANCVLFRGAGARLECTPFDERHGTKSFFVAPTAMIRGLGISLEMDEVVAKGATGDYRTNLFAKSDAVVESITSGTYDFGFCHVKAVDDAGHDRDLPRKVEWLQRADKMLESIVKGLAKDTRETGVQYAIVVTGDHSTPVIRGDHSAEPVPFAIAAVNNLECSSETVQAQEDRQDDQLRDSVAFFGERYAFQGALGRFRGLEVMSVILRFAEILGSR